MFRYIKENARNESVSGQEVDTYGGKCFREQDWCTGDHGENKREQQAPQVTRLHQPTDCILVLGRKGKYP